MASPFARLKRELRNIQRDPPENCSAGPKSDDDLLQWQATIVGPEKTPYHGGIFKLDIDIPQDYPFKPPKITFVTKIFHKNVSKHGVVCLDILRESWSPALTIAQALLSICSFLANPDSGMYSLELDRGQLFLDDRAAYDKTAREWTLKYAN